MIIWYTERYYAELQYVDFPGGSDGKASAYDVGDPGLILGLGRSPGEENDNPLQYSCVENPHGQRSMVGYSPWGCKRVGHYLVTKQQKREV